MQNHLKNYLVCTSILLCMLFIACKKVNTFSSNIGYQKVKVFDDSLADYASIPDYRLVAGNDRLYMIYSIKDSFDNNYGYLKLIITDNEGNVIKTKNLGRSYQVHDLLVTKDNICNIVRKKISSSWSTPDTILLTKLDHNGNLIAEKSLASPPDFNNSVYQSIKLFQTPSGNLLMYGLLTDGGNSYNAFALEYNQNQQIVWSRKINTPNTFIHMSDCLLDSDGGYIFLCTRTVFVSPGGADQYLLKMNANGDTLWTKTLFPKNVESISFSLMNFFRMENGNYHISMNCTVNDSLRSYLYKFNSNGDSLSAMFYNKFNPCYFEAILKTASGKTFCLVNNSNGFYSTSWLPISVQLNSRYLILDDDLNIIKDASFQNGSKDYLNRACITSDNRIACFGLTQITDRNYFKPELIILN